MVPRIRKILFASDLTENSRHAFYYAATMAKQFGASMIILHVSEKMPAGVQQRLDLLMGREATSQMKTEKDEKIRQILIGKKRDDDIIRKAFETLYLAAEVAVAKSSFDDYDIMVQEGDVAGTILKIAEDYECSLVVVGTHKGLLGGVSLGGDVKKVLHGAKVPVFVVPPPTAEG